MDDFILSNKERLKIFKVMTENKHINFNSIVKLTDIRSNKLSYQLNLMQDKGFVEKDSEGLYILSKEAQKLIPYFSQIFKKEVGVLPVILGIVLKDNKILLIKRKKMPYKDHWGIFGGKQISGESISETIVREVKEEANLDVEFRKCNAVVYERLYDGDFCKHSFLFTITTVDASTFKVSEQDEGEVKWFNLAEVMSGELDDIVPSDIIFLNKYLDQEIVIDNVIVNEKDNSFNVN